MTLPGPVSALIASSIHSPTTLELVLLLRRSPDTYWSPAAAASAIGVTEARIHPALQLLEHHGLVVAARGTVAYRYAPGTDALRESVDALATAYEQQRVMVLDAVQAAGSTSIDAFAAAFRIRRR